MTEKNQAAGAMPEQQKQNTDGSIWQTTLDDGRPSLLRRLACWMLEIDERWSR